jgi:hypothetical protein
MAKTASMPALPARTRILISGLLRFENTCEIILRVSGA